MISFFKRVPVSLLTTISALALVSGCLWDSPDFSADYLPLDDSEYPYAEVERLVIETENFREVRNVETEIPAMGQFYGEKAPEGEPFSLTIRGRGNSSFEMPKFGYKIELDEKTEMLGMPADKDWALLPNYLDKTLLRDALSSRISETLGAPYSPRSRFVELYLNRSYLGVYQLSETVKKAKFRIRIPDSEFSFLVELDHKYRDDETIVFSASEVPFRVHVPKAPTSAALDSLVAFLDSFESFSLSDSAAIDSISRWIDLDAYIRYYWIQEFSKNIDGNFNTSVYFTWQLGDVLRMGPVWDFALAFGGAFLLSPQGWYIRNSYWNASLFRNAAFAKAVQTYWTSHRDDFLALADFAKEESALLSAAAANNFRRWPTLESDRLMNTEVPSFKEYGEAVDSLCRWIQARADWIDGQYR